MRKKNGIKLRSKVLAIVILLICFLILENCLAIGQENTGSKEIDINKFQKEYQTSEFNFTFKYLCDESIKYFIAPETKNVEAKKVAETVAKHIIGNHRAFLLKVTALRITKFDPTKLVFVQGGKQFNIEVADFKVTKGGVYKEIYPGVSIEGFLFLPLSFDPTISTSIWYKREKLGNFMIPVEYKDLVFAVRKPVKIKYLTSSSEEKRMRVDLVLEDEYGASTKWDGIIKCQLRSLKGEKLLYEEKRKVSKEDFYVEDLSIHGG